MPEFKAVRLRRGRKIHATADYQTTACARVCVASTIKADACPDCPACLVALLEAQGWRAAK